MNPKIYIEPGAEKWTQWARQKFFQTDEIRRQCDLVALKRFFTPEPGVRIELLTHESAPWIRVFGASHEYKGQVAPLTDVGFAAYTHYALVKGASILKLAPFASSSSTTSDWSEDRTVRWTDVGVSFAVDSVLTVYRGDTPYILPGGQSKVGGFSGIPILYRVGLDVMPSNRVNINKNGSIVWHHKNRLALPPRASVWRLTDPTDSASGVYEQKDFALPPSAFPIPASHKLICSLSSGGTWTETTPTVLHNAALMVYNNPSPPLPGEVYPFGPLAGVDMVVTWTSVINPVKLNKMLIRIVCPALVEYTSEVKVVQEGIYGFSLEYSTWKQSDLITTLEWDPVTDTYETVYTETVTCPWVISCLGVFSGEPRVAIKSWPGTSIPTGYYPHPTEGRPEIWIKQNSRNYTYDAHGNLTWYRETRTAESANPLLFTSLYLSFEFNNAWVYADNITRSVEVEGSQKTMTWAGTDDLSQSTFLAMNVYKEDGIVRGTMLQVGVDHISEWEGYPPWTVNQQFTAVRYMDKGRLQSYASVPPVLRYRGEIMQFDPAAPLLTTPVLAGLGFSWNAKRWVTRAGGVSTYEEVGVAKDEETGLWSFSILATNPMYLSDHPDLPPSEDTKFPRFAPLFRTDYRPAG